MTAPYDAQALAQSAIEASQRAYHRYSGYQVGAALLTSDGTLVTGCNIENAAYAASICAERTAISKAVSEGHRAFAAIAVCTPNGGTPCGFCRQVMNEFNEQLPIILTTPQGDLTERRLDHLLAEAFGPRHMQHVLAGAAPLSFAPIPDSLHRDLARRALEARRNAYAPYSRYPVGSALLTGSGTVITSASVENALIPATICAPHGAFLKAVSAGQRDFVSLAIATRDGDPPCGICRQVIEEFAPDLTILLISEFGAYEELPFAAVLTRPFGPHPT